MDNHDDLIRDLQAHNDRLLSACIAAEHYLVGLIGSYGLGCECPDDHPIITKLRDAIGQTADGSGAPK